MEAKEFMFDKDSIVNYLMSEYENLFDRKITPIKLQKSLYFLFAHFGGFINSAKTNEDNEMKSIVEDIPTYLFEPSFEAWDWGPVDRSVYGRFANNCFDASSFDKNEFFKNVNSIVVDFIEQLTPKILKSSDFGLVDLSHKDTSWIDNYNEKDKRHNKTISGETIIDEYTLKYNVPR